MPSPTSTTEFPRSNRHSDRRSALAAGCLIAITMVVLWIRLSGAVEDAGWLGWDAYPILESSRVDSASDTFDVLTRRLAGEHLKAGFYRPLFVLSVAAEQSWLDASTTTSLVVQVALFGGCLLALWWWLGSLAPTLDGIARPAGLVALGLLALHPSVLDIVPFMPRRPDLMCTLFVLLALRLDRLWLSSGRRAVLAGSLACACLAMASKEAALALPILVVAARALLPVGSERPVVRDLARPFLAYAGVVGVLLLPRLFVLGGAGGYPALERGPPFSSRVVLATLVEVLAPHSGLESRSLAWVAVTILGVAIVLGLGTAPPRRELTWQLPGWLRLAAFAAVWCLALALLFAFAGRVSPWYVFLVGCGGFAGLGAVSVRAWQGVCTGGRAELAWGVSWLLGLVVLAVSWWPGSLAGGSVAELRTAGRRIEECFASVALQCRNAEPGSQIDVSECPVIVAGHGRSVAALKPRSIVAWAQIEDVSCALGTTNGVESP